MKRAATAVCYLLLLASAAHAYVSESFPIASPRFGPASSEPTDAPLVAASRTGYLVVWDRGRRATRVSKEGDVLDPAGINLGTAPSGLTAVASDGTDYLGVVISAARVARCVRISAASGEVTQLPTFSVPEISELSLLWNGDFYLFWFSVGGYEGSPRRLSGPRLTQAMLLDRDGLPRGVRPATIGTARVLPAVAARGRDFLFAFADERSNVLIREEEILRGSVEPLIPWHLGTGDSRPAIASSGDGFLRANRLVVAPWAPARLRVQLLDAAGSAVGDSIDVASEVRSDPFYFPDFGPPFQVTWTGTHYLVTWSASRPDSHVAGVRFSREGVRLDDEPIALEKESRGYAVASVGDGTSLIARSDGQIFVDRVDEAGGTRYGSNDAVASLSDVNRAVPVGVWRRNDVLLAWGESDGLSGRLVIGRITRDGRTPDGAGLVVRDRAGSPAIDGDGTNVLIASSEGLDLALVFVDESMNVVTWTVQPGSRTEPVVKWTGSEYLVLWRTLKGSILAIRVDANGRRVDTDPIEIVPEGGAADQRFVVSADDDGYLVGWTLPCVVYVRRFTKSLAPAGPVTTAMTSQCGPRPWYEGFHPLYMATDGDDHLLVWDAYHAQAISPPPFPLNDANLRAVLVSRDGTSIRPPGGFIFGWGRVSWLSVQSGRYLVNTGGPVRSVNHSGEIGPGVDLYPFINEDKGTYGPISINKGGPADLVVYASFADDPRGVVVARFVVPRARAVTR